MHTIFGYLGKTTLFTQEVGNNDDVLHDHSFVEIFYITSGSARHLCNGKTAELIKGSIFFLRPTDQHMFIRKPGEICIHRDILITLQRFHDFCDMIDPDLFPLFANSSQPLSSQLSADEFNELEEEFNDYAVNPQVKVADHVIPKESLLISKMVNLYAQRLIHEQKDLPDWIQKLLDRMSNPLYFNTSLQEILDEQKICYEKAYLCRVFKKYVGCSMIAYITNSKLNHAVSLLRFTSMPIANIASQSGFANVTYFNKLFKRSFGIPPAKYRILITENSDIR